MVAVEQGEGELPAGTPVLRRYSIVGKLAQGGMAEVYLARQQGPAGYNKLVVVKRVRPHLANDADFVGMFVNEARLAAMINHPNVVQIFDLGDQPRPANLGGGTDWFLAMEYLDGRDMLQVGRACRSNNKAVPFDVTARIIADACAGLDHAHGLKSPEGKSLDLVHRDMSPENVLITFEGQVKVVDFGIAKASDNLIKTQAGQIKGKLGYVAPEAILGKAVDARADVFAIGATLYLFLSGRPAFTGTNPMEIFERSLKPPVPPREVNSRVPEQLDAICMRALAQDRDRRYRSAGEVRIALEAYLQSTGRPLGPVQLGQFMRILFPPDKDPVRQRIDKLIADAAPAAAPAPLPVLEPRRPTSLPSAGTPGVGAPSSVPPPRANAPAPVVVDDDDDNDKTNIVPPREHPADPATVQGPRRPVAASPPHLRSVGLAGGTVDVTSEEVPPARAGIRAADPSATAEVPRPTAVAAASRAPAPVTPTKAAPPTIELDDGDAVADDIDLDAPTVEVQAITKRNALASQIDVAASLFAGAKQRPEDVPPPPLDPTGVRRPPAPPGAAPPSAPPPAFPSSSSPAVPAAVSAIVGAAPAPVAAVAPSASSAPPPAFPLAPPSSSAPPTAAPPSAFAPVAPASPRVAAPVSAEVEIDIFPTTIPPPTSPPAVSAVASTPAAPSPPTASASAASPASAAAAAVPAVGPVVAPAFVPSSPAGEATSGALASPASPAALPGDAVAVDPYAMGGASATVGARVPDAAAGPARAGDGVQFGLKAAMFVFGALTGVVLLFLFLWVSGLSARVFT